MVVKCLRISGSILLPYVPFQISISEISSNNLGLVVHIYIEKGRRRIDGESHNSLKNRKDRGCTGGAYRHQRSTEGKFKGKNEYIPIVEHDFIDWELLPEFILDSYM